MHVGTLIPHFKKGTSTNSCSQFLNVRRKNSSAIPISHIQHKIDFNRRMNETLEALAQTLFKKWFVDAAATKLPKGWRAGTLGEVAENPRRGIQPDEIKSSTPYIGLEHMPRRCIALVGMGTRRRTRKQQV